jgi:ABC-type uncharacterized transport system substrate-binding protein
LEGQYDLPALVTDLVRRRVAVVAAPGNAPALAAKAATAIPAVWPVPLRAQQPRPVIGFLGTVAQEAWVKPVAAFEERLRERGWIDGRTINIVYRWAEGRPERFAEIATEFVNSNVDVIVTGGNAVSAVRQATSTIPIGLCPGSRPRW